MEEAEDTLEIEGEDVIVLFVHAMKEENIASMTQQKKANEAS